MIPLDELFPCLDDQEETLAEYLYDRIDSLNSFSDCVNAITQDYAENEMDGDEIWEVINENLEFVDEVIDERGWTGSIWEAAVIASGKIAAENMQDYLIDYLQFCAASLLRDEYDFQEYPELLIDEFFADICSVRPSRMRDFANSIRKWVKENMIVSHETIELEKLLEVS